MSEGVIASAETQHRRNMVVVLSQSGDHGRAGDAASDSDDMASGGDTLSKGNAGHLMSLQHG